MAGPAAQHPLLMEHFPSLSANFPWRPPGPVQHLPEAPPDDDEPPHEKRDKVEDERSELSMLLDSASGTHSEGDEGSDSEHDHDAFLQRKLRLFETASVQQSIRQLWDILPLEVNHVLSMDGYVELNLRLQKLLVQRFELEEALDAAIGDWSDEVALGQIFMTVEEFSTFIFELCSEWCAPCLSLRSHLFFMNALFVAVSEANGLHTIGMKKLEALERLPQAFFDLLKLQCSKRQPGERAEGNQHEDEAFEVWCAHNFAPDKEKETFRQVQRQLYQVTHDIRSTRLFTGQDGRPTEQSVDMLMPVKVATANLGKVVKVDAGALATSANVGTGFTGVPNTPELPESLYMRPWCPPTHTKPAFPASRGSGLYSRRGRSLQDRDTGHDDHAPLQLAKRPPGLPALPMPPPKPRAESPVPVGQAYSVRMSQRGRGLIIAGQAALASPRVPSVGGTVCSTEDSFQAEAERHAPHYSQRSAWETRTTVETSVASPRTAEFRSAKESPSQPSDGDHYAFMLADAEAGDFFMQFSGGSSHRASSRGRRNLSEQDEGTACAGSGNYNASLLQAVADSSLRDGVQSGFFDGKNAPPYGLPNNRADLHKKQVAPHIREQPRHIVVESTRWQKTANLLPEPFERVLMKLPDDVRPTCDAAPRGPLKHTNEPVWFEMNHRLAAILRKQGKRAERVRRKRLRSKVRASRNLQAGPLRIGRELQDYFARCAEERAVAGHSEDDKLHGLLGGPAGEFLGKVHERYLLHRQKLEDAPFRYRGVGGISVESRSVGEPSPRRPNPHLVRPVFVATDQPQSARESKRSTSVSTKHG